MERTFPHLTHALSSWKVHASQEKINQWMVTAVRSQHTGATATHSSLKRRRKRKNQRLHRLRLLLRLRHHRPLLRRHLPLHHLPHHRQLNLLQVTTVLATGVMVPVQVQEQVQELMLEMMLAVLALRQAVLVAEVLLPAVLATRLAAEAQRLEVVVMLQGLVLPPVLARQVRAAQFLPPLRPHQPLAMEEVQEEHPLVLHLPQRRWTSPGRSTWMRMRRCPSKASRASSSNTTTGTP